MWSDLLSSKKCVINAGNEKTWPFYTDPGKKRFWIHDEARVRFCYFYIFLLKLCTVLPNTKSVAIGALTRYVHSDLSLYAQVGVPFDNLKPIRVNIVIL